MNVLQLLLKPKWQSRLRTGTVDVNVLNGKALGGNCILLRFVFDYSWTFPGLQGGFVQLEKMVFTSLWLEENWREKVTTFFSKLIYLKLILVFN